MDVARTPECKDLGGTIRTAAPEETLRRLRPLLPALGITRVAHVTGLDHIGIPVCVAVRPAGRLASNAQGKGVTNDLAEISAISESIETWHAENIPQAICVASYRALALAGGAARAIDPWTLRPAGRLDDDTVLPWLPALELPGEIPVLLPRARFDMDTTSAEAEAVGLLYHVSTNGLAAGNTRSEAVIQGLCEVIERDARHKLDRLAPPAREARRVDLATIEDAHLLALIGCLHRAGIELEVVDMTSDIAVPAFLVHIFEPGAFARAFVDEGMGAHLRPEIALSRAILEAVQSRLSYISGTRDDLDPDGYRALQLRAALPTAARGSATPAPRTFAACLRPPFELSIKQNISHLLETLCGMTRIYILDHTRVEWGIPVVHVVCPELASSVG